MKKYLAVLILGVFLIVSPIKAYAVFRVDENGNPIKTETKEGEVRIMMDEGSGVNSSEDNTKAPDNSVSSDDPILYSEDKTARDLADDSQIMETTSTDEELLTSTKKDEKDKTTLYVAGSGVAGIAIGATLVYFIKRKKI